MEKQKNKLPLASDAYVSNCRDVTIRKLVTSGIFLVFFIMGQAQVFSPEVVSSAGATGTSASCIIDWTLGEIAVETYTQSTVILTQGFQQNFITGSTAIEIAEKTDEFSVFPNPVRDHFYLTLKPTGKNKYLVELYNIKGIKVWNTQLEPSKNTEKIDVNDLPPGVYMVRIATIQGKSLKTSKFIKL